MMIPKLVLLAFVLTKATAANSDWKKRPCSSLQMGQFKCNRPEIDDEKQTETNCTKAGRVLVACMPARGIICDERVWDGDTEAFHVYVPCRYVTSYHYKTAVLLSVFLGMFGFDRLYLGYMAIGLLKFCTFGFMLIGYLIDMILIITQTLKPIDGSNYIVDYYGQVLYPSAAYNNYTFNLTYY